MIDDSGFVARPPSDYRSKGGLTIAHGMRVETLRAFRAGSA